MKRHTQIDTVSHYFSDSESGFDHDVESRFGSGFKSIGKTSIVLNAQRCCSCLSASFYCFALLSAIRLIMQIAVPFALLTPFAIGAERCAPVIARLVSLQGNVALLSPQAALWQTATTGVVLCPQDQIRVGTDSRAALLLANETTLRLNQKTTMTINSLEDRERSFIELINGALHVITRTQMPFQIHTPFVNANIEGTEFAIAVDALSTTIAVVEGQVAATNTFGRIVLVDGETGIAIEGTAPSKNLQIRPADAVQWALYYPTIIDTHPFMSSQSGAADDLGDSTTQAAARRYQQGQVTEAIALLDAAGAQSDRARSPDWLTFHAGLLLAIGRIDDARREIDQALGIDSVNVQAYALKTIIAVVQNDKDAARRYAEKATSIAPSSAVGWIARSYAEQAQFRIDDALASVRKATMASPRNGLAWARLAEMEMCAGNGDNALSAANQAAEIDPDLAKIQTVLGFSHLMRMQTSPAKSAFDKAIARDQSDPLPRLGLGLAQIRDGNLVGGRTNIVIAASLDPSNPLIRSYLGKAYYEERRGSLAAAQLTLAKSLDPRDPTPWFYDALRKQTDNRPVEALSDLQHSIALNQQRAVYRSQFMLDSDRASRQTSLAKIYDDLALYRFAVTEATHSLNSDPSNYSSHRFLSDAYARLDRHEIASVSELLQSQLLQPLNLNPVQPKLAFSNVNTPGLNGPMTSALNEFNPLFERDGVQLIASGIAGSQGTVSAETVVTGLQNQLSYSAGGFHYKSDGFRGNNDIQHNIVSAFVQYAVSPQLNFQAEIRHRETGHGDISLNILPGTYSNIYRRALDQTSTRLGAHWSASSNADTLVSVIHTSADERQQFGNDSRTTLESKDQGVQVEAQQLLRYDQINLIAGGGSYRSDVDEQIFGSPNQFKRTRRNAYAYAHLRPMENLVYTLGTSFDNYAEAGFKQQTWNPKFGVQWQLDSRWRIRAATFKTVKPALYVQQTIEPTQVAGFNQFFDDGNGARAQRDAVAIDLKTASVNAQLEASRRRVSLPILADNALASIELQHEQAVRLSIGWRLGARWTIDGEARSERFWRSNEFLFGPERIRTDTAMFGLRYFNPNGLFTRLSSTLVRQRVNSLLGSTADSRYDHFGLLDAAIGLRLPRRMGTITIEGKNLLDKKFRYQDANFRTPAQQSPPFIPARNITIQATAAF